MTVPTPPAVSEASDRPNYKHTSEEVLSLFPKVPFEVWLEAVQERAIPLLLTETSASLLQDYRHGMLVGDVVSEIEYGHHYDCRNEEDDPDDRLF